MKILAQQGIILSEHILETFAKNWLVPEKCTFKIREE